jgi:hypothetical protein
MNLYNWFMTKSQHIIRYTNFGQVNYYIAYRKQRSGLFRLVNIHITTKNMGTYNYEIHQKLDFDQPHNLIETSMDMADEYIFYQIKHTSLMEVKFFDNETDYLKYLSQ